MSKFFIGVGSEEGAYPSPEKKIKTQLRCELHYRAFM